MTLEPGSRLGPYEIVSAVGAGGMGEVYRAHDSRLGRDVAIKVLPPAFSADPERLQRFEQEARAAAALNHPNILAVHDIGQHDDAPYIVSELLEGDTLRDRLNAGAILVRKAIEYAIQIAHGLAAAHEKGIVHRDLKPENVFVTSDGRVKILDFGLAKLTQAEPATAGLSALPTTPPNTSPGVVLGTIGYMSPEQVRGLQADHRSDIFAFGAVLYELLSGTRAFQRETSAETMTAILKEDPADLSTSERHIPHALARIADHCLEKSPSARFRSANDLAFALESVSLQAESSATAAISPGRQTLLQNARVAWGTAGSLLLALLAIATALYLRPGAPTPVVTRLDVVILPTNDPFSFALSPDGRQLVFVAIAEGEARLWLRPLDQVSAQPLAGTEGASYPFWAPDSSAVGFFAESKLKRVDLAGGTPQVLADAPAGRGGTWNRDGVVVFAPSPSGGLMRVMATGGTPTTLVAGEGQPRWPQFLPDGRKVLFFLVAGQGRGVYVLSLDGGEPARVLTAETAAAFAPPGYLMWVSNGVLVAQPFDTARATVAGAPIPVAQGVGADDGTYRSGFSVSATGVLAYRTGAGALRRLVWVDRSGKELGAIGPPDENVLAGPELSPDGQTVAMFRQVQGNPDVWLVDVVRKVASRFTFDIADERWPVWSPDGSRVAYGFGRKGVRDLFEKPVNRAAEQQSLLVTPQDKAPLDWSRDGGFLLFAIQDPKTASDLWALPLAAERKPFPVVQTGFEDIQGQFSPDGRWLAYASNESGRYEIYVQRFPESGAKWLVSTAGGTQPRWQREGHELFYVAPNNRLMAVSIRLVSDARPPEVGAPVLLFPTRLAGGAGVPPVGFDSRAQYAVAPDGRFLLNIDVTDSVTSPTTVALNWTAALKK